MTSRPPPPTASIAQAGEGAKLVAPSAQRNSDDICALLKSVAPAHGDVLEIASGTGQHITQFAAQMPHLHWHPSEVTQERIDSISAYIAESGLPNVAAPHFLNACRAGWSAKHAPKQMIYLVNLLHLISTRECLTLINEAAQALTPDGCLILYGPFMRSGALTSAGDQRFDATLRASDPQIGYKDDQDIIEALRTAGLAAIDVHNMPANNLAFVARSTSL